ncbi:hypothetical protein RAD15_38660 [Bradyrhizobium sp. 14AA]
MEGFSRLLNYLGNVKARITSKIVRIFFEKSLRLRARDRRVTPSLQEILERRGARERAVGVLQLDEAERTSPN